MANPAVTTRSSLPSRNSTLLATAWRLTSANSGPRAPQQPTVKERLRSGLSALNRCSCAGRGTTTLLLEQQLLCGRVGDLSNAFHASSVAHSLPSSVFVLPFGRFNEGLPTMRRAVEDFAAAYEQGLLPTSGVYRHPLPMRAPRSGEQYAFDVDLDACTGCKACVTACHSLNGLDVDEAWRRVALLVTERDGAPILQHVTTSCHHCLSPACLEGCPANAYAKDPLTGIVRHLDDLCIGCRYCTFTCPYDAPQYVARLGIVRKCDMCVDRVNVGEPPACVQGCPNGAIKITLVKIAESRERAAAGLFLPVVADPRKTQPTSVYRKRRWPERLRLADVDLLQSEEAHWPLALMLVLTQLAVGAFLFGQLVQHAGTGSAAREAGHAALPAAAAVLALGASLLHLGRPLLAWRALLGLRHSWLSREVFAFGLFALGAGVTAAIEADLVRPTDWRIATAVSVSASLAGGFGLFASVMVYRRTARPLWRGGALRFGLSAFLLGASATLAYVSLAGEGEKADSAALVQALAFVVLGSAACKLAWEAGELRYARRRTTSALGRSAHLLVDVFYQWTALRFLVGWLGGVVLPLFLLVTLEAGTPRPVAAALLSAFLLFVGEFIERALFFRAGVPAANEEGAR